VGLFGANIGRNLCFGQIFTIFNPTLTLKYHGLSPKLTDKQRSNGVKNQIEVHLLKSHHQCDGLYQQIEKIVLS
jgi:hypothetical protein